MLIHQGASPCASPGRSPYQRKLSFKSPVSNWTEEEVQNWLKKKKLVDLCNTLEDLEGSHLEKMYDDYCRDPKEFKHEMRSDYQMTAKMCLKFIVALEKLIDHN